MGMLIAYHQGHIANMGQPPTLSGLSVLRGAPSRTARTPRYTCRPALHGGRTHGARRADIDRTRAFGRRLEAPPRAARSALLQNLHFLVWRQGGLQGWFPPQQAFRLALETRGVSRCRERCRPIAWMPRKLFLGLRRMISHTTGPSGASPRPRAPRGDCIQHRRGAHFHGFRARRLAWRQNRFLALESPVRVERASDTQLRANAFRSAARLRGHPFRGRHDPNDVGARRRRVSPPSLTQTLSSLLVDSRAQGQRAFVPENRNRA